MEGLEVWLEGHRAGHLRRAEGGGLSFRYDPDWLEHPAARPLSVSLPLGTAPVLRGPAATYFRALLPDEPVRTQIADKLGLPAGDDFALLSALGGECAGAVSLQPEGLDPTTLERDYAPLNADDLEAIGAAGRIPLLTGRTRATLCGDQHKLPVLWRNEALFLPVGPSPTTHILKFGSPELSHLPANEAFTTLFARELGLRVPLVRLLKTRNEPVLLCERFDRRRSGKSIARIHQEDFLQALGPRAESAPFSFTDAIGIVRRHCAMPLADTHRLLVWLVFHLIAGDSGAEPKNLALLHDERRLPSLAPFFDLVCTRAYRKLDRDLGMDIAGLRDPVRIGREQWSRLAGDIDVKEKALLDLVGRTLAEAEPALSRAEEAFRGEHGDHPILRVVPVMRSQIDWIRNKLR